MVIGWAKSCPNEVKLHKAIKAKKINYSERIAALVGRANAVYKNSTHARSPEHGYHLSEEEQMVLDKIKAEEYALKGIVYTLDPSKIDR